MSPRWVGRALPAVPGHQSGRKTHSGKIFSKQSLKSAPSFPLSPNGAEGRGEGEVIFTAEEIRCRIYEPRHL
jgi:hypothetical protein